MDILTNMVLVKSEKSATIHAPVECVDIADWLLHLPDAEYQRCAPPDHIAAGTPTTDGRCRSTWRLSAAASWCSITWPKYMSPTTAGWCRSAMCKHRLAGRRST